MALSLYLDSKIMFSAPITGGY